MANSIFWGKIYESSWFGEVNADNGWGIAYPSDADGSTFRADTTLVLADTNQYTADQTQY